MPPTHRESMRGDRRRDAGRREGAGPSVLETAAGLAAKRPFTRKEMRSHLLRRGHDPGAVDAAIARLEEAGVLDDAKLAEQSLLSRASRLRRGPERLFAELERRGVPAATVRAAWDRLVSLGDVDPDGGLAREVERRVGAFGPRLDRSGYSRVYNALLRAGFEPEAVEAAMERHRPPDLDA